MEDTAMPRFQLMDDIQLQDLIDSADSKNTKYAVKYGIKIFEEFLRNVNTDLGDVNRLPNADLDKILQKPKWVSQHFPFFRYIKYILTAFNIRGIVVSIGSRETHNLL